jgi:lipase chaperone LimK
MIKGLAKHAETLINLWIGSIRSPEELAARFQAHLEAMATVAEDEIRWRIAIQREEKLEKEMKALLARVVPYLLGAFGEDSATLRDFGLEPRKKPKTSVATKLRAVEKRKATRALRKTMGKKQRLRIKGTK